MFFYYEDVLEKYVVYPEIPELRYFGKDIVIEEKKVDHEACARI